ncbi:phospholipase A2 inhibitor and Ly6/PLAUR domain-containing protein-like [Pyxicephalus adspersus]|uniref:phospholipase A2 inhibitor and Ly6/PLAUR domain-containing protein-like n=1 Tax=Pyxicephalus adspersus TaxID=30357 RepID=UPI003B5C5CE7
MASLLAVVCLLSGLLAPGYAISCAQCLTTTSTSCGSSALKCASNLVCISIYQSTWTKNGERKQFIRGCGRKRDCDKSGVFSIPESKYRFSATCCDTSSCTPKTPVLPDFNFNLTTKTCTYCVSSTDTDCKSEQVMNCTKNEEKCATQNSIITAGSNKQKSSVRGCASKSYCELKEQKSESGGIKTNIVIKCSACTALYSALTLLITVTASIMANVF